VKTPAIASPADSGEKMIDEIDDFSFMMKTGRSKNRDRSIYRLNKSVPGFKFLIQGSFS